jgi:o-succinylbenzoate synthase
VRLVRVEITPFALPLRAPLHTARGAIVERRGALVTVFAAAGERGHGEASPVPGFGEETPASCLAGLPALAERLLRGDARDLTSRIDLLEREAPALPAARFALECALQDLEARQHGVSLAAWLAGGVAARKEVEASALVEARASEAAAATAARAAALGFGSVKLKLGTSTLDADVARVGAVRRALGPDTKLRLDANASWQPEQAVRALRALAPWDLELVEQPVAAWVVTGLARVRAESGVPTAADESAADPHAREALLAARAADFVVLKPGALGGLRAAWRLALRARAAGMGVVVTSGLDGSVARAAALALAAALPGPLPACGLATGALLARDLGPDLAPERGRIPLPDGPGLGIELDASELRALATGPRLEVRAPCA